MIFINEELFKLNAYNEKKNCTLHYVNSCFATEEDMSAAVKDRKRPPITIIATPTGAVLKDEVVRVITTTNEKGTSVCHTSAYPQEAEYKDSTQNAIFIATPVNKSISGICLATQDDEGNLVEYEGSSKILKTVIAINPVAKKERSPLENSKVLYTIIGRSSEEKTPLFLIIREDGVNKSLAEKILARDRGKCSFERREIVVKVPWAGFEYYNETLNCVDFPYREVKFKNTDKRLRAIAQNVIDKKKVLELNRFIPEVKDRRDISNDTPNKSE